MSVCKYGCGAEFPNTPDGQAALMRHYKWDCQKNPNVQARKEEDVKDKIKSDKAESTEGEKVKKPITHEPDEYLDEQEILEKIIAEATKTTKRPAIVRMVRRHLGDKKESVETLAEALRIADIPPSQRNLILRNWATHMDIPDIDEILKIEKSEEKIVEKKKEEEKELKSTIEEEMERSVKDEVRALNLLRLRKERRTLERDLEEPKKEAEAEKLTHIVDGVSLKVTPQEMLAWKRWETEQKKIEEEREERKEERKRRETEKEEKGRRNDDELVEWIVDGNKVIKVRPETIPMLVMQQSQKKNGGSDEMKNLRDELKSQRDAFQQFQTSVLQKEINELKTTLSVDPIERLFDHKDKLEKLGIVSSSKTSAQEQMYAMDRKKLDTMLDIVLDKSRSTEHKVDSLVDTFGPVAKEYVREAVLNMKQQRGEDTSEVPRSEAEAEETLKTLEEVDKAMSTSTTKAESKPEKPPKVVSIPKTEKKSKTIAEEEK